MSLPEVQQTETDTVPIRVLPDGRLDRRNAARYLGRAVKTLATWSTKGKGPRPVKIAGRIFYFKDALDEFINGGVSTR